MCIPLKLVALKECFWLKSLNVVYAKEAFKRRSWQKYPLVERCSNLMNVLQRYSPEIQTMKTETIFFYNTFTVQLFNPLCMKTRRARTWRPPVYFTLGIIVRMHTAGVDTEATSRCYWIRLVSNSQTFRHKINSHVYRRDPTTWRNLNQVSRLADTASVD
jgi:hypothetical protein